MEDVQVIVSVEILANPPEPGETNGSILVSNGSALDVVYVDSDGEGGHPICEFFNFEFLWCREDVSISFLRPH